MTNVDGTNLIPVEASEVTFGQKEVDGASIQLTTETGPLSHGIFLQTAASSFYVNAGGTTTAVTTANGVLVKANNPMFIPIKDPSQLNIISSGSGKMMTFIMC